MASVRKRYRRDAASALARCLEEPLRGSNGLPTWLLISGMKRRDPNAETALYRHYDEDGRLLYVGISLDVLKRIQQHRGSSWSRDITYIAIEGYASREAAEAAERVAIETERPLYNIAGRLISVVPTAPEVTNGHHS
jgi:predicted GIY-YIG superfamily endonuclease